MNQCLDNPPPPWVRKALKASWSEMAAAVRPEWLPDQDADDLGCGHYGCVLATDDPGVVLKITSDPTEADFVQLALSLGGLPDGLVDYHEVLLLDFSYRKRKVWAIWREAAYSVGELYPGYSADRSDYEVRSRLEFVDHLNQFKNHAARFRDTLERSKNPGKLLDDSKALEDWAWNAVGIDEAKGSPQDRGARAYSFVSSQRGAYRLAASWRACGIISETMEHAYLSDLVGAALSFYMEHGILLADVHAGNIGRVERPGWDPGEGPWVITDPGHAVVVDLEAAGLADNPPMSGRPKGWWRKQPPRPDKISYETKTDALNKFLDANWRIVEAWGGPNRKDDPSVFDRINDDNNLKGKRQVDTLAKAAWWALRGPRPWYLADIDIELLNETGVGTFAEGELGEGFRLPDYVEEQRLLEQQDLEWIAKYGETEYPEDEEVPF